MRAEGSKGSNKSRVLKHRGGCSWKGVRPEIYKKGGPENWTRVARHLLVAGQKGENTKFHLRYFEVSPGGYTSLETHRHEHVVVVIKGRGQVRLGRRLHELDYLDTIYIGPDEPHRLLNPYGEPFGFFCIVDARRDKPVPLEAPLDQTALAGRRRG
ncbi:MAG: cupin domain-containing protein [Nitrospiraceae bacterium]|nr:cupin domain-containing protein [Nitrospiraceae bacterium]